MANIATDPATGITLLDYEESVAMWDKILKRIDHLNQKLEIRSNTSGARASKKRRQLAATENAHRDVDTVVRALNQHFMTLRSDLGVVYASRRLAIYRFVVRIDRLKERIRALADREIKLAKHDALLAKLNKRLAAAEEKANIIDRAMMADHI